MGQRWLLLVWITLGGCFSPKFNDGAIQCGPDQLCPPGFDCAAGVCRSTDQPIEDAPAGMVTLSVTRSGNGMGGVQSAPAGLDCGPTCTRSFPVGTMVTLTATPQTGSTFTRWSGGACSGSAPTCSITLTSNIVVDADFGVVMRTLTVVSGGNGTGSITSSPTGINCPGVCTLQVPDGAAVVLTATPTGASTFLGWTGPGTCTGTGTCNFNITADTTVTGAFALDHSVVVLKSGTGTGTVSSSPVGIDCGGDCSEVYPANTTVTLNAVADANSNFNGWAGACSGAGPCVVTLTTAVMVTAMFELKVYPVTVSIAGNGAGVVTSPSGIMCNGNNGVAGGDCSENVAAGTVVTLSATPSAGSVFSGWDVPACTSSVCTVTVSTAMTVTAFFTLTTHPLTVTVTAGQGVIQSVDGGINCGTDCVETYDYGTIVTLVPVPGAGQTFLSWNGACSGPGSCAVTMDQARTVGASFGTASYLLKVALIGTGSGSVTAMQGGISCDGSAASDCDEVYPYDTDVTLTATANAPSFFVGWSGGGCSGNAATCLVDMLSAQTVTANFSPPPNRMFVTSQTFVPGALGGFAGADLACQNAANAAGIGGTNNSYRAWLSTTLVNAMDRLAPASGWVRTDGRAFANTPSEIGNGLLFNPPRIDELGNDLFEVGAFTATTQGGGYDFPNTNNGDCGSYSSTTGSITGGITSSGSTMFTVYGSYACNQPAHLYCFGVDRMATVVPNPPVTAVRRAFMRFWTPGGGILDADAQCQADASLNGLPGTYKALLPTTSGSALSRFDLNGPPWIRVDDVPILPTAADWGSAATTFFNSGPNLSANGTFTWSNYVHWSGAANLSSIGTLGTTCNNWTDQLQTATYGIAGHTRLSGFTSSSPIMCDFNAGTVTCLQE